MDEKLRYSQSDTSDELNGNRSAAALELQEKSFAMSAGSVVNGTAVPKDQLVRPSPMYAELGSQHIAASGEAQGMPSAKAVELGMKHSAGLEELVKPSAMPEKLAVQGSAGSEELQMGPPGHSAE